MSTPVRVVSGDGWAVYFDAGKWWAQCRGDGTLHGPFRTQGQAEAYAKWKPTK